MFIRKFQVASITYAAFWITILQVSALDVCENQEDGSFLAHPADCSKFIMCNQGLTATIQSCPVGFHFNREISICDYKARAGCDINFFISRQFIESDNCCCLSLGCQNTCKENDCQTTIAPPTTTSEPPTISTESTHSTTYDPITFSTDSTTPEPTTISTEPTHSSTHVPTTFSTDSTTSEPPTISTESTHSTTFDPITTHEPTTISTEPTQSTTHEPTTFSTDSTTPEPTTISTEPTHSTTHEPTTFSTDSTTPEPTTISTDPTHSTTHEPTTFSTDSTTPEHTTISTEPTHSSTHVPTTTSTKPTDSTCNPLVCNCNNNLTQCLNEPDGAYLVFPGNCSQYIVCTNGCSEIMTCPSNLYFNIETSSCDYRENVVCEWSDSMTILVGPSGTTCDNPGSCLGMPEGALLPDPETNGYLVCQCGCEIKMNCPPGLVFNTAIGVCDWPVRGVRNIGNLNNNNTNINGTIFFGNKRQSDICNNHNESVLLPVEGFCNKFYICSQGYAYEVDCPDNLIFNSTTQFCDYPENVECSWPYQPPAGPSAGPSGTACENGGRCVGQHEGTLLSSTQCAEKYVVCQCGCEIEMNCPKGLYFDENLNICNFPV